MRREKAKRQTDRNRESRQTNRLKKKGKQREVERLKKGKTYKAGRERLAERERDW